MREYYNLLLILLNFINFNVFKKEMEPHIRTIPLAINTQAIKSVRLFSQFNILLDMYLATWHVLFYFIEFDVYFFPLFLLCRISTFCPADFCDSIIQLHTHDKSIKHKYQLDRPCHSLNSGMTSELQGIDRITY